MLKTIYNDEEYLRQISKPVDFADPKLSENIAQLKDYTYSHSVWAMASVQIGIPKRLIFMKATTASYQKENLTEDILLINPKVLSKKGKTLYWEACESCLPYAGLVERPYQIELEFQDEQGTTHTKTFKGFESTVLSHELDHLDGIVHMDRAIEVRALEVEDRKAIRVAEPYKIISEDCSFEYGALKRFHKN